MFNPNTFVIDGFVETLKESYERVYGLLDPEYGNVARFVGRISLENIANSDAAYHDVNHTIMVTQVGIEILRGKQISQGGVSTKNWLNFVVSLLCHDIGYIRGVCRGDTPGNYVCNLSGDTFAIDEGATDAALTPYHVQRSQIFVRERFKDNPLVDSKIVEANIESTEFPVPQNESAKNSNDYTGLLRAADLIGQLADLNYERKQTALFHEFQETGTNEVLGYKSPADLRANYPKFFWNAVFPFIGEALRHLSVTQDGKQWIANLYANVFSQEHGTGGTGMISNKKEQ